MCKCSSQIDIFDTELSVRFSLINIFRCCSFAFIFVCGQIDKSEHFHSYAQVTNLKHERHNKLTIIPNIIYFFSGNKFETPTHLKSR